MSGYQRATGSVGHLSPLARQALREIVAQCLANSNVGQRLPEHRAVDAAVELLEHGWLRLEYDPIREAYWLEVTE